MSTIRAREANPELQTCLVVNSIQRQVAPRPRRASAWASAFGIASLLMGVVACAPRARGTANAGAVTQGKVPTSSSSIARCTHAQTAPTVVKNPQWLPGLLSHVATLEAQSKQSLQLGMLSNNPDGISDDAAAAFTADGDHLAVADGTEVRIWSTANQVVGFEQLRLQGHKTKVSGLEWNSDGSVLETESEPGDPFRVRLWSSNGQDIAKIFTAEATAFSPDGAQFAWLELVSSPRAGMSTLVLRLADVAFKQTKTIELAGNIPTSSKPNHPAQVVFSPDNKTIAVTQPWDISLPLRLIETKNPPAKLGGLDM